MLGRAVKVRFEKVATERLQEAPAEIAGRERSTRQQATEQAMNDDPVVQTLLREFDARIIPESIKPNV